MEKRARAAARLQRKPRLNTVVLFRNFWSACVASKHVVRRPNTADVRKAAFDHDVASRGSGDQEARGRLQWLVALNAARDRRPERAAAAAPGYVISVEPSMSVELCRAPFHGLVDSERSVVALFEPMP